MELKEIDKKILAYIYHNSRDPATKIAKELKITREQVIYRINKLESEGIIKGYIPLINYNVLGYNNFVILFIKTRKNKQVREFRENLKQEKNRINTVELIGKFNLASVFIFKNEVERNESIGKILEENSDSVQDFLIIEPYLNEFYPLKSLGYKEKSKVFYEKTEDFYSLDEKEKKILNALNKDANIKIVDIAKKTNLSAELIVYKLKKLKEKGILVSTRAYFDLQKIGYHYTIIFINFLDFSKKNIEKLKEFARNNSLVDSLVLNFSKPNSYLQIFHKDMTDLHEFIENLESSFPDNTLDLNLVPLKKTGEDINTLPFL